MVNLEIFITTCNLVDLERNLTTRKAKKSKTYIFSSTKTLSLRFDGKSSYLTEKPLKSLAEKKLHKNSKKNICPCAL